MRTKFPASLLCDFYKIGHKDQYPENTQFVYSTWIPRTSRLAFADKVVAFGFQGFIKEYLMTYFNENFFNRSVADVCAEYVRVVKYALGVDRPMCSHIADLHALGYLPLLIKAVPEGTLVPVRVPMLTVENTDSRFGWLTNYIETLASCSLWQSATSATIAHIYRQLLDDWARKTSDMGDFVQFQGHDFSMRGMGSLESAVMSGAGHLLSFVGTDSIPAITYLEEMYGANIEMELVGCSVPATEHSVMCAGGVEDELGTYRRLLTDIYPSGIVSIVSDTWDLWEVVTRILPILKDNIMARDGKVVIRPDSGDPADIICGTLNPSDPMPARQGLIEMLWRLFGGTTNSKGFRQLDPHIGAIYGDAITVARAEAICHRLSMNGFASTNIVFGIGSYTYQYNTRDTFGFAMKSTQCVVNGREINIFKDPATDEKKIKKSLTGKVAVVERYGELTAIDGLSSKQEEEYPGNLLRPIFYDGILVSESSLSEIRARIVTD